MTAANESNRAIQQRRAICRTLSTTYEEEA